VASVFDFGEIELEGDGPTAFIVMELLEGTRLADITMPVPPVRALRISAEVAAALAAAHAKGVVHRDVKPGNVMLTDAGVKMFDFGIAASVGAPDLDSGAVILGSPRYVAPERLLGEPVTAASDVYSLGVMLYCLLTGGFPWPAGTVSEMVMSHVAAQPADMPDIAGVPDEVRAIYRQAVARDPQDRPDAAEIATVLANAAGIPVHLGDDGPGHVGPASRRSVRRSTVALLGLVMVVAVGGAAVAAWIVPRGPASLAAEPIASASTATTTPSTATTTGSGPAPTTAAAATPSTASTPKPGSRLVQAHPGNQPPLAGVTTNPAPPPSATQGPPTTFDATGGQVVVICQNNQAILLSWVPNPPYRVDTVVQGPATEASVVFRRGLLANTVTVSCAAGVPVATESDS
jgi:serine/threonine-protein kinase